MRPAPVAENPALSWEALRPAALQENEALFFPDGAAEALASRASRAASLLPPIHPPPCGSPRPLCLCSTSLAPHPPHSPPPSPVHLLVPALRPPPSRAHTQGRAGPIPPGASTTPSSLAGGQRRCEISGPTVTPSKPVGCLMDKPNKKGCLGATS